MPRAIFEGQLTALHRSTVILGEQAATAVEQAIAAFVRQDLAQAQRVVDEDAAINRWERQVLDQATLLLTLQGPVAIDLRRILGVSRVAGHFERIGDHARDIARATIRADGAHPLGPLPHLQPLIDAVAGMARDGLRAYDTDDVALARQVCRDDDRVDAAYAALFTEILALMATDTQLAARGAYTLFVARDLERIADYTANVAETLIYVVTGQVEELN